MPAVAQQTLTVYDGTDNNGNVPVYGFYADAYNKCQMIMPATDLSDMTGGTITKMTWYLTTPAAAAWGGNFKIYVTEVNEASLGTEFLDISSATLVYDGALDGTGETMGITFTEGYTYGGGNLLIAVYQTATGTYKSASFAGTAVTGASITAYSYSSLDAITTGTARNFLPKTTFEYTPGSGVVYYKPKNLAASDITTNSATITWEAGGDETSWGVEYKKAADEEWTSAGTVTEKTLALDALANGTMYDVRVKSIYADGESGWVQISFATLACEETDMGEVEYTLTDAYGDGWSGGAKLQVFLAGTDVLIQELAMPTVPYGQEKVYEITGTFKLCYGVNYDLVWVAGTYNYECGYVLTAPDGDTIAEFTGSTSSSGGTPTPGVLTTFQINQVTCPRPTDVTASNITYNGATISWTPGDAEQDLFEVVYVVDPNGIDMMPVQSNEPTVAITGLQENASYSVYVRSVCSDEDQSNWSEVCTFTTPEQFPMPTKLTITDIKAKSAAATWEGEAESYKLRYRTPANFEKYFFESFESTPTGWTANEWGLTNISNATMEGVPLAAADGNYCIASCSVDANYDYLNYADTLISPQVDLKGNLILYAADLGEGFEENFSVYVSTSGTEAANFTPLGENIPTPGEVPTSSDKWGKHSFDLSAYEGQQGYIAIVHNRTGNSGYYLFIDAVTIAGADIPAGEWVIIDPATSPQALEGLTPSTTYEVEVQAVYADGASQWSEPVEFTTLAADANPNAVEVTDVTDKSAKVNVDGSQDTYNIRYRKTAPPLNQINEDFETMTTGSNPPEDWTMIDADDDGYCWYGWAPSTINDSKGNPTVIGTAAITSASYMGGALYPDDWLITPKVNLGGTVSFMYRGQDPSYPAEHFGVYVSVAGNTSPDDFVAVSAETVADTIFYELTVDLSAYEGKQGYIAIRHFNCSDEFRLNIDNFVYNNNDKENEPAGDWTVVEGVEVPYTIEGLDPETEYEVQVQGVVDEQNTTEWTASELFTTLEYIPEYGEFYLVGTFNDWNQLEDGGRIELLANADGTEYSTPVTLAQGDKFKIITFDKDGNMIWIGAESNGNFLVLPEYYGSTPITLIFGDEGKDFEMQEGGNFKITVKAAPVEEPAEPSGIAPKAVAEPLVMVIDKITGIETIDINNAGANEWYNLNGQKLNGKPTVPGIYINGHRKVIIK